MWFLLLGVLAVALKYFEVGPVGALSWWIVISAPDEILLMGGGPDVPFEDSVEHLKMFAEKVMPQLRDTVRQ